MEASALPAPAGLPRIALPARLGRLRSDDQLVALFRAGDDAAFAVIHDRYRHRLFAYVRQMLPGDRQDAEDVLQDVFVRAYGALRQDDRPLNLRAWLYRVAHNRCIDHLRRPTPPAADVLDVSRRPLLDPILEAERRHDLKRLVEDVRRLPEQQRSALLLRELDGLSYVELADVLGVSLPAVKSLLVRARLGLVEAAAARDADCGEIRRDLVASQDRGVRASGRARRHLRECLPCREYRIALRGVQVSFRALAPAAPGPFALLAKLCGVGGVGAGGGAAAGGGVALTGAGAATAGKVAAVVCCAVVTAGGAAEVEQRLEGKRERERRATAAAVRADAPARAPGAPAVATATRTFAAAGGGSDLRTAAAAPAAPGPVARDAPAAKRRGARLERRQRKQRKRAAPAPAGTEPGLPGAGAVVPPGELPQAPEVVTPAPAHGGMAPGDAPADEQRRVEDDETSRRDSTRSPSKGEGTGDEGQAAATPGSAEPKRTATPGSTSSP